MTTYTWKTIGITISYVLWASVSLSAASNNIAAEKGITGTIPSGLPIGKERKPRSRQLTIREIEPLAFGLFVQERNMNGRVLVDPRSKNRTAVNGKSLPSISGPAKFEVNGEPNQLFTISLPAEVPMRTKQGHHLRMVNLNSHPSQTGRLGPDGRASFHVGGTLLLDVPSIRGPVRGGYDVFVEYVFP